MRTLQRLLSHKPSGRAIQVQLRTAEDWDDMAELCGSDRDPVKAEELALAIFNGGFAVKFQAANRDELGEAEEAELETVIANLQKVASEGWTFDGRGERKPKAPKEVKVEKKSSYSQSELDAILAKVGAKAV